jgi:hypothetical protein
MLTVTAPTAERRSAPRLLGNRVCYARPDGSYAGVTWGATLHDLSPTGAGLVLRCALRPGTLVVVQPTRGRALRPLLARVLRAAPWEGHWLHGCQLLMPLAPEEVKRWMGDA